MTTEDVFEFEGDQVTDFLLAVPSVKVESDMAYPRGTHLNVKAEFRVRSVRIEEDRKGNLTRHHVLVAETFRVTSFQTPEQRRAVYEAEEAEIAAANAQSVIQEQPGIEDTEGWGELSEEEKIAARRAAVDEDDSISMEGQAGPPVETLVPHSGPGSAAEPIEIPGDEIVVGELIQEEFVDATPEQEVDSDQYETVDF